MTWVKHWKVTQFLSFSFFFSFAFFAVVFRTAFAQAPIEEAYISPTAALIPQSGPRPTPAVLYTDNDSPKTTDETNQLVLADLVTPAADKTRIEEKIQTNFQEIENSEEAVPTHKSQPISPTPAPTPTLAPSPTFDLTPIPEPTETLTPSPTPQPASVTAEQLDNWFKSYSGQYSVSEETLRKIAVCESRLNPNATWGPYAGMYQFATSSWTSTRNLMNLDPNPDLRFNAEESIKTAAFKMSVSGTGAWPSCSS